MRILKSIKTFFRDWYEMDKRDAELMFKCYEKYGIWKGAWYYILLHVYLDLRAFVIDSREYNDYKEE